MPRLTPEQRERAIGMAHMGATNAHIARTFGCSRVAINNLMQRYRQTGQTLDRPRTGRPRVTTSREDRYLRTLYLRDRFLTAASSAANALDHVVSRQTVTRRLRERGIRAYRPYTGQLLTPEHRRRRLTWYPRRRRWLVRDWQRVVFSDESRFCLYTADGRQRVYRRRGERTAACCVRETVPFGGGSVMVWGAICGEHRSPLIRVDGNLTAQRYRDQIFDPVAIPFLQQQLRGALYQHDNARPHTGRIVQNFLEDHTTLTSCHGHHALQTFLRLSIYGTSWINV